MNTAGSATSVRAAETSGRTLSVQPHSQNELDALELLDQVLSGHPVNVKDPNLVLKSAKIIAAFRLLDEAGFTLAAVTGIDSVPGAPSLLEAILQTVDAAPNRYGIPGPQVSFKQVNQSLQEVKTAINKGPKGEFISVDFDGQTPGLKQTRDVHIAFPDETASMDLGEMQQYIKDLNKVLQKHNLVAKLAPQAEAAIALPLGFLKTDRVIQYGWLRVATNDKNDIAAGGRGLNSDADVVYDDHVSTAAADPSLRAALALESQKN